MSSERRMFIDGEWADARDGGRIPVFEPSTGAPLASVPAGTEADVHRAVTAARRAFDGGAWNGEVPPRHRAAVLNRIAGRIRSRAGELARLEVRDSGKPLGDALAEMDEAAFIFEYYAGWATKLAGEIPPVGPEALNLITYEPVGVCGLIVPWNFPLVMAVQKIAPALAAGCTAVLKPAEDTPLTALELAGIAAEAGLPAGALNVVTGTGPEAGAPLVAHPAVDKVSFTGSRDVGVQVATSAAATLKRVTLELGGKSPNVVFADAEFTEAVAGTCRGIFTNQGEVCSAGSRVLIQREIFDDALEALAAQAARIRLGDGLDTRTTMGPLVSARQRDRVMRYIEIGEKEGARAVHTGSLPGEPELAGGYFVPPVIFHASSHDLRIAQEEIFGPVMTVLPFDGVDEAIRLANDTAFGLGAAIWTNDVRKGLRVAKAVRAGVVWLNDTQAAPSEGIWGGFKASGVGRELGRQGLEAYLEAKQIHIKLT
ncbi:aldehyde dehydrogenase family protein [Nonomuraea sp. CA-141351]|uniref:aldehyde dehydrogenase family protein n=1 Tax=Nonomuraea sp. CA-141351 TaxID=3239996 RepID=UPI003D8D257F